MSAEAPTVEEKHTDSEEEEEESDEETPELAEAEGGEKKGKQNRAEKKARKAVSKLGMKTIAGVNRVTIKKSKQMLFVISEPDVLKSATTDTYVVFGEAKIEDLSAQAAASAAQGFRMPEIPASSGGKTSVAASAAPASTAAAAEGDAAPAPEGVEEKDIDLVIAQTGATRARAIEALKNNDNDIVNAIMELSV